MGNQNSYLSINDNNNNNNIEKVRCIRGFDDHYEINKYLHNNDNNESLIKRGEKVSVHLEFSFIPNWLIKHSICKEYKLRDDQVDIFHISDIK